MHLSEILVIIQELSSLPMSRKEQDRILEMRRDGSRIDGLLNDRVATCEIENSLKTLEQLKTRSVIAYKEAKTKQRRSLLSDLVIACNALEVALQVRLRQEVLKRRSITTRILNGFRFFVGLFL